MYRVSCEVHFCYGHRLLRYEGKCRHLHGHNGLAVITLEADRLDPRGMVSDFSEIKRVVAGWIDAHLDHRMILCRDDPAAAILRDLGEPLYLIPDNPTAEAIARLIYTVVAERGYPVVEVRLWETPQCHATYTGDSRPG